MCWASSCARWCSTRTGARGSSTTTTRGARVHEDGPEPDGGHARQRQPAQKGRENTPRASGCSSGRSCTRGTGHCTSMSMMSAPSLLPGCLAHRLHGSCTGCRRRRHRHRHRPVCGTPPRQLEKLPTTTTTTTTTTTLCASVSVPSPPACANQPTNRCQVWEVAAKSPPANGSRRAHRGASPAHRRRRQQQRRRHVGAASSSSSSSSSSSGWRPPQQVLEAFARGAPVVPSPVPCAAVPYPGRRTDVVALQVLRGWWGHRGPARGALPRPSGPVVGTLARARRALGPGGARSPSGLSSFAAES
jgi:hypothetical protein